MIEQEQYLRAYRSLVSVARRLTGQEKDLAQRVQEVGTRLNEAVVGRVSEIDVMVDDGEFLEAAEAYRDVIMMRKLPVAKTARERVRALAKNPRAVAARQELAAGQLYQQVDKMLAGSEEQFKLSVSAEKQKQEKKKEASRNSMFGDLLGEPEEPEEPASTDAADCGPGESAGEVAEVEVLTEVDLAQMLEPKEQLNLLGRLERITTHYPETSSGGKAAELLGRLQGSEAFMQQVSAYRQERDAASAYKKARLYGKSGRRDLERDALTQVVEEYPETTWAGKAREALGLAGP